MDLLKYQTQKLMLTFYFSYLYLFITVLFIIWTEQKFERQTKKHVKN